MNNNEVLESIKRAFKLTIEKLDNHYMFYLNEMVTPKLITLFYWILLFAFIKTCKNVDLLPLQGNGVAGPSRIFKNNIFTVYEGPRKSGRSARARNSDGIFGKSPWE